MAAKTKGYIKTRTIWLFVLITLLYVAVGSRLAYVQVAHSHQYREWAKKIRSRVIATPATRGGIYDRTGRALAVNVETASVFANTKEVRDPANTAVRVAALIGGDPETIEEKLSGGRRFVWLGRQLDAKIGDEVWKTRSKIPGVGMQRDTKRVYPTGALAANIIGFTNIDNVGAEGIECVQNKVLTGHDGLVRAELDDERRIIPETRHVVREPEHGKDVYLTIDAIIQNIAEQALARMAQKYKPESACAIVLDPRTGEILALANIPTFDPNNARSMTSAQWRNRAVADLYEPGSTLKAVTISAGMNEGFPPGAVYAHCTGYERINGGGIPCSLHYPYDAGHGAVNMPMIIRESCNIGAAHIALKLGAEKLYKYEKAFGLLDKADAGFGCEAVSCISPAKDWRTIRLADIGFGQGIAVTPLQMASVYATIANGGMRVQPRIIREIRNHDGSVVTAFKPRRLGRVISKAAADELRRMLVSCVEEGTGKPARIDGRTVAGKTGSAQVPRTNGRGYEPGVFVASFMGFAPAFSPRLAIAVVVKHPKGSHWGATVAAPVFQEIGEKALWYLKVPSDAPTKKELKKDKRKEVDQKRLA